MIHKYGNINEKEFVENVLPAVLAIVCLRFLCITLTPLNTLLHLSLSVASIERG